jgi:hypothetical protein
MVHKGKYAPDQTFRQSPVLAAKILASGNLKTLVGCEGARISILYKNKVNCLDLQEPHDYPERVNSQVRSAMLN